MTTHAEHAAARGPRVRRDLIFSEQWFRGRRYWVAKDPASLEYYRFRDLEYAVLRQLDGRRPLPQIKQDVERQFGEQISTVQIEAFVADLFQSGLAVSNAPGHGKLLAHRRARRRRSSRWSAMLSVLAIRFPGFDPDAVLSRGQAWFRGLINIWTLLLSAALVLSAAGLVWLEWPAVRGRLPELHAFVGARNLVWLAGALAGAKIMHEAAHAITCKRFGGECHEVGLMLLVLTPCLYCDVSDSWMQPSRWKRMAVSAAGIWVEMSLAAICVFGWWFSRPGLFNSLCLNLIVVCGAGTLFINGNPLLRYDGYYLLSDLLDAPNLWQQSRTAVRTFLARWLLGVSPHEEAASPPPPWMLLYGLVSMAYRVVVLSTIVLLLHRILIPRGFGIVAFGLALSVLAAVVAPALWRTVQFLREPNMLTRINLLQTAATMALGTVGLVMACRFPLPFTIEGPVAVMAAAAEPVYVQREGQLAACAGVGDSVAAGGLIASLTNPALDRELDDIRSRVERQQRRILSLEARRAVDASAAAEIPAARQLLSDLSQLLRDKRSQAQQLQVKAPRAGTVLPPPRRPPPGQDSGRLGYWHGTPLEDRNRGCWLPRQTLLCLVGDKDRFEAVVVVDEADVDKVSEGQEVRLRFDTAPGQIVQGTVREIAVRPLEIVPNPLKAGYDLPFRQDEEGVARPLRPSYQVKVGLDTSHVPLVIDARGRAKICVSPSTLADRLARFIQRTFRVPQ